jgi:hypothetical protein
MRSLFFSSFPGAGCGLGPTLVIEGGVHRKPLACASPLAARQGTELA